MNWCCKYSGWSCGCDEKSIWTWKGIISLKRVLLLSLCVLVLFGFVGCREKGSVPFENDISEEIIDNSTESQISA